MTTKKTEPVKRPVDQALIDALTPETKKALRAEAAKTVAADMEQDARDAYFQRMLAEARRGYVKEDQLVYVTMDFPSFVNRALIDNVEYHHGYMYEVPMRLYKVLVEQMARAWLHQDELDGRSRTEAYQRMRSTSISPHNPGPAVRGFAPGHTVSLEA